MKNKPSLSIIHGLLFTYNIENTDDLEREKFIASKNINSEKELIALFDRLTKPEFLDYTSDEQEWFIATLTHFLAINESFDTVFKNMETYFSSPIINQRKFMQVLLTRLKHYCSMAKSRE